MVRHQHPRQHRWARAGRSRQQGEQDHVEEGRARGHPRLRPRGRRTHRLLQAPRRPQGRVELHPVPGLARTSHADAVHLGGHRLGARGAARARHRSARAARAATRRVRPHRRARTLLQDARGLERDEPLQAVRRAAALDLRPLGGGLMAERAFRLGYNTNGFAHHRLDDALHIIAELGYRAVALTPDANHLHPDHTSDAQLLATRALLDQLDLSVVIETGARYVLDPRRKQRPTLIEAEAEGRERRLEFLERCARIAAALGGDTISLWSGILSTEMDRELAWSHLVAGVRELHERITPLGVRIAFEPEPGMLVNGLADWERLCDEA